jgi:two-component system, cell cycle response regulator DivK
MPNILLVEDDDMNRDMMARHLKWEGYQVITAVNGVQAVALAQSGSIDLILMDMRLPILNGWEATVRLKAAPATRAIPIIALTAYALSEERAKCIQVGCDEYEGKPINFPRLLEKMGRFLNNTPSTSMHKDAAP